MDHFEKQLGDALRREAAPADFAAKVLARVASERAEPKVVPMPVRTRRTFTLAMAASLAMAALIPTTVIEYRRQEAQKQEARAMKARQDLVLALSITQDQLDQVREKIQRKVRLPHQGNQR